MNNAEWIAEISRKLWELSHFADGQATVPAYLLEQLAIATEVIGIEQAEYNERNS